MRWHVETPETLAQFLASRLSESGKSVRRKLEARLCRVNGQVERFGSRRLSRGDRLEIAPHWKKTREKEEASLLQTILYEDDDLLFVDKPAGVVCDAGKRLPRGLLWVHRLDRETTGALAIAKRKEVQEALFSLFAERTVEKEYRALVDGVLTREEGVIESSLVRKRGYAGQTIWGSSPHGREKSVTRFRCLAKGKNASWVACFPETGRTHQIRVHLAEMGHPILGDRQYAASFRCPFFAERILLHAGRLAFCYKGKEYDIRSPVPKDMEQAVDEAVLKLGF